MGENGVILPAESGRIFHYLLIVLMQNLLMNLMDFFGRMLHVTPNPKIHAYIA